jgi:hypothetical protein
MQDISTGAQTLTAAGVVTGVLDVSAFTARPTIRVDVTGLTAGSARIEIQDTANSSEFSDAETVAVFDVLGPSDQIDLSQTPDLMPSMRFGAAHNQLRANVTLLTASTVTVHAYVG